MSSRLSPIIDIGYQNLIVTDRVVAIIDSSTANAAKVLDEAKSVIDATKKSKTLSLIVCIGGVVVKSSLSRVALGSRLQEVDSIPIKKRKVNG